MESPFFVLNKIEAAGTPERTAAGMAVPGLKAHDFEFISLSDAV